MARSTATTEYIHDSASQFGFEDYGLNKGFWWTGTVNELDRDDDDWRQDLAPKRRSFAPKSAILLFELCIPSSLFGKFCFVEIRNAILSTRCHADYYFTLLDTHGQRIAFRYVLTIAGIDPDGGKLPGNKKTAREKRQEQILKAIADGDVTIFQMMQRLRVSNSVVKDQLNNLQRAGKIGFHKDPRTRIRTYYLTRNQE